MNRFELWESFRVLYERPPNHFDSLNSFKYSEHSEYFKYSEYYEYFKRVEHFESVRLLYELFYSLKKLILTRWNAWGGKRLELVELLRVLYGLKVC